MVKHVILWNLKDELSEEEKAIVKAGIKEGLEGLQGKIPGLLEIKVNTNPLPSSNCDVMLDSSFTDEASLKGYAVHPDHVAVADGKVRPYTKSRVCMDYESV
ncbi:MAG: Dabb family protein [Lachnospiraceae bacterium]|nr:Dabb family protein [Lachnospiraceae bacterium]